MFELLTDCSLFQVDGLEGDAFYDEETNDEHLIQIFEILGPLPSYMFHNWRRGHEYFNLESDRLRTPPEGDDELQEGSASDYASNHDSGSVDNAHKSSTNNSNGDTTDVSRSGSSKRSAPLANPPRSKTLEERFRRRKSHDVNVLQEKEVVKVLRWILQPDPELRPSVDEILQRGWFQID